MPGQFTDDYCGVKGMAGRLLVEFRHAFVGWPPLACPDVWDSQMSAACVCWPPLAVTMWYFQAVLRMAKGIARKRKKNRRARHKAFKHGQHWATVPVCEALKERKKKKKERRKERNKERNCDASLMEACCKCCRQTHARRLCRRLNCKGSS